VRPKLARRACVNLGTDMMRDEPDDALAIRRRPAFAKSVLDLLV